MKTAEEILEPYVKQVTSGFGTYNMVNKHSAIKAMETYATQQTADLTTQLAKANSDKEKMGELLTQYYYEKRAETDRLIYNSSCLDGVGFEEAANGMEAYCKQITECLTDCGITL
jgi:hypothetical protein